MITTVKNIYLDFYNHHYVVVHAKQGDTNSRCINVTCTDYGKKIALDKNTVSAFVRMKKADGNFIYDNTEISDDGTILITLSQQMLAACGRQIADIVILSTTNMSLADTTSLDDIQNMDGVTVISVMSFYLNVTSAAVQEETITSTSEFSALTQATVTLQRLEENVRDAEDLRIQSEINREGNESTRIIKEGERDSNETERISNENTRKSNEIKRQENEKTRQDSITGEAYRIANEISRNETFAQTIQICNEATQAAQKVVEDFKSIQDFTGIIKQEEKGSTNGVATLDDNGKIPSEQLDIVNNLTTETTGKLLDASQGNAIRLSLEKLQQTIDELQKIHFADSLDDSIGKNGDILLIPVS